jgi:hypothetical protein
MTKQKLVMVSIVQEAADVRPRWLKVISTERFRMGEKGMGYMIIRVERANNGMNIPRLDQNAMIYSCVLILPCKMLVAKSHVNIHRMDKPTSSEISFVPLSVSELESKTVI